MFLGSKDTPEAGIGLVSYVTVAYVGAVLNMALIILVLKDKTLRSSSTYIVLVNLASADCLSLLLVASMLIYSHFSNGLTDGLCSFSVFTLRFSMSLSAYTLTTFSLLRYLLLVHPLFARRHVTSSRTLVVCLLMWPTFMAENAFTFWSVVFGKFETTTCFFELCLFLPDYDLVLGILILPDFVIPFLLITGFHVAKLARFHRNVLQNETHREQKTVSTRAVMAIIIVFLVCYLPYNIMMLTTYLFRLEFSSITYPVIVLLSTLTMANSIFNPILYFFLSRHQCGFFSICRKPPV